MASAKATERPEDILGEISADLHRVRAAERTYIEWVAANKNAPFAEFTEAYFNWVDAGEAFERRYKTIEERHPSFIEEMLEVIARSEK